MGRRVMTAASNCPKALIVSALAGFVRSFLMSDVAMLQDMGYEVHCAANAEHAGADDVVNFLESRGVIFHQVCFSSSRPASHESVIAFREMRKLAKCGDFKFVHCHTPIAGAICREAFRKQQREGVVLVAYTTHGFYFHKKSGSKSWLLYRTAEDFLSRWSDVMITINREDYGNALRMHCPDIRYIPGVGVDIDRFHNLEIDSDTYRRSLGLSPNDFVILAVGEISARKNQKVIVEALAARPLSGAVFVICGNCMTSTETKDEIERLASEGNVDVRFLGRRNDVAEICKCADVGVLPSTREGLGLAGIEMLASGLPVIGSDVHGIPDYLINDVNGVLCDPSDVNAFGEAMRRLYDDPILRERLGANGYESVRFFSLDESARCMERIYRDVLRRGGVACA